MISQKIKAAIAGLCGSPITLAALQRQNEILLAHEQDTRERARHFDAALSNMAQGLCMFDERVPPRRLQSELSRPVHAPGAYRASRREPEGDDRV